VDKPAGLSSFAIVDRIKRRYSIGKAGHAGTLDPFARGVLVLLLNSATRKFDNFLQLEKEYTAEVLLGKETDTLDITGSVVKTLPIPQLDRGKVESILQDFVGIIDQKPPRFSAKHFKGERFYELARKNVEFEIEPSKVEVKSISLNSFSGDRFTITAVVKRGVYIRSLALDMAIKLGTVGVLNSLTRTRVGPYRIEDAVSFAELDSGSAALSTPWFIPV